MAYKFGANERLDLSPAVVVGAGAMGMAVARRLAPRHRLLLADIDAAKADAMAAVLNSEGAHAAGLVCDITNARSVARLAEVVAAAGGLGVLVHVAALSPAAGDFRAIMKVNLGGPHLVTEALLPYASTGSAAILISSLAAHTVDAEGRFPDLLADWASDDLADRLIARLGEKRAVPGIAYALAKRALLGMVRAKVTAWGAKGARILSLSPGMIATPMGAKEFENSEGKRQLFQRTPLQREGTLHEIADAIEFLASERASFITGTDLLVDGGLAAVSGTR